MLVIALKLDEVVHLQTSEGMITIRINEARNGRYHLAIEAPRSINIYRDDTTKKEVTP